MADAKSDRVLHREEKFSEQRGDRTIEVTRQVFRVPAQTGLGEIGFHNDMREEDVIHVRIKHGQEDVVFAADGRDFASLVHIWAAMLRRSGGPGRIVPMMAQRMGALPDPDYGD